MGCRIPGLFGTASQESERMGKPSCSILHEKLLGGKKQNKTQVYEQFLLLKKFLLKLSHMNVGIAKGLFKKIFSRF